MLDDEVEEGELVWSGRRSRPINLATKLGVFVMPGELISDEKSIEEVLALVVLICIPFWNFKIGRFKLSSSFVIDDNEVPSDESKLFLGASTPFGTVRSSGWKEGCWWWWCRLAS